jgi:hypothetical protein
VETESWEELDFARGCEYLILPPIYEWEEEKENYHYS